MIPLEILIFQALISGNLAKELRSQKLHENSVGYMLSAVMSVDLFIINTD